MEKTYGKSRMDILHYSKAAEEAIWCIVKFQGTRDKSVLLSYDSDGINEFRNWRGTDHGHGHYVLYLEGGTAKDKAIFHRMPETDTLNGYWAEHGIRGMWRVLLKE